MAKARVSSGCWVSALTLRAWSFADGEGWRVQFTGADLFEIVQT